MWSVDGWVTSVQQSAFSHCPTIFWSIIGRCALLTARSLVVRLGCLVIVQQPAPAPPASQQCQAGLGSSPRARCSLRQGPRQLAPSTSPPLPIGSRGWSGSIPVSSRLVSYSDLDYTVPFCPPASLVWIGARLPGCEASPKHGDLREPATAAAAASWSMAHCRLD